jgi:hypothetical protein
MMVVGGSSSSAGCRQQAQASITASQPPSTPPPPPTHTDLLLPSRSSRCRHCCCRRRRPLPLLPLAALVVRLCLTGPRPARPAALPPQQQTPTTCQSSWLRVAHARTHARTQFGRHTRGCWVAASAGSAAHGSERVTTEQATRASTRATAADAPLPPPPPRDPNNTRALPETHFAPAAASCPAARPPTLLPLPRTSWCTGSRHSGSTRPRARPLPARALAALLPLPLLLAARGRLALLLLAAAAAAAQRLPAAA